MFQKDKKKMPNLKHIGRVKSTGRKVVVAYRTLPGESDAALVVQTEGLTDSQHDTLINLVESAAGQNAYEFAEVMARSSFPEGGVILNTLHSTGRLTKVKTSEIEMIPNMQTSISLDNLNQLIAEQRGISVNDLALGNQTSVKDIVKVKDLNEEIAPTIQNDSPLSDDDIARKLRSDADRLYKEASRLRSEAEKLSPTKKKAATEA